MYCYFSRLLFSSLWYWMSERGMYLALPHHYTVSWRTLALVINFSNKLFGRSILISRVSTSSALRFMPGFNWFYVSIFCLCVQQLWDDPLGEE